jgi:hypothetical protein
MIVPAEKSAGQNSAYRHHTMKGASETERPSLFATHAWVDSFTSSTPFSIFRTVGCNSLRISCSFLESSSMLWACWCSSFSMASWRCEIRCIHQKQTAQHPTSRRVTKFTRLRPIVFEIVPRVAIGSALIKLAALYGLGERRECC